MKRPAAAGGKPSSANCDEAGWRDRNKNTKFLALKKAGKLPAFVTKMLDDAPNVSRFGSHCLLAQHNCY